MQVNEIFLSIQGEGPQLGMPAWFVRFSECNFDCSFCDSKYAKKGFEMSINEIVNATKDLSSNVILTGGEPMMQPELLELTKELLHRNQKKVYIETNGAFYDLMIIGFATFIVSPKLDYLSPSYLKTLKKWVNHGTFKFVIRDRAEFDATVKLCNKLKIRDVYFMPEGIKEEMIKPRMLEMANWIKDLGWGYLTPRLQIYLWGMKRGT